MESLGLKCASAIWLRLLKPTSARRILLLLLAVAGLTASGCSRKQPDAPRGNAAPAPEVDNTVDLTAVNQALKDYARDKKRVPPNLDVLVAAGYLPKAPQPPPGKRFAIDPQKIEVRIEAYGVGF